MIYVFPRHIQVFSLLATRKETKHRNGVHKLVTMLLFIYFHSSVSTLSWTPWQTSVHFPISLRTDLSFNTNTAANAKCQRLNLLCLNKNAALLAPV